MPNKYIVRYKLDLTAESDDIMDARKEKRQKKNPIGITKTLIGTREEIKKRINHEIDDLAFHVDDFEDVSTKEDRLIISAEGQ